ncbi:plasmid partitioning protein RepB [Mesorhizobium sp. CAU 1741]|uniref:plasmid partitioning protein RepB n=1 Tax=Mesorhizobium sp. CAU 1741 TaxID=3140366 RepID=UPI00325B2CF8
MARKHLLSNIGNPQVGEGGIAKPSESRAEYARRGASRSMMQTLDEMAENSMRLLEGDAIVQLDPSLLDPSPYQDRLEEDEEAFDALVSAIREAGQNSPILVRPNPDDAGRFVIVYGHRRAKAARQLGVAVRAVIKPLEEISHVIAQGQENTARADLTFIEKALFARKLMGAGISKDNVKKALTVDDTLLSRMLAVAENVPAPVLDAVGAAKGVGRDRWEDLKKALLHPARAGAALDFVAQGGLDNLEAEQRFNALLDAVTKMRKRKPAASRAEERRWTVAGNAVQVAVKDAGRTYSIELKAKDASGFGTFVSENLDRLYDEYRARK